MTKNQMAALRLSDGLDIMATMKIEYLSSDNYITLMTKGHVNTEEMKINAAKEHDLDGFKEPRHVFMRARPHREYSIWFDIVEDKGRGCFPATIMEKAY